MFSPASYIAKLPRNTEFPLLKLHELGVLVSELCYVLFSRISGNRFICSEVGCPTIVWLVGHMCCLIFGWASMYTVFHAYLQQSISVIILMVGFSPVY